MLFLQKEKIWNFNKRNLDEMNGKERSAKGKDW